MSRSREPGLTRGQAQDALGMREVTYWRVTPGGWAWLEEVGHRGPAPWDSTLAPWLRSAS